MHIKSICIEQLNVKERTTKRHPVTVRIKASLHLISKAHVKLRWNEMWQCPEYMRHCILYYFSSQSVFSE